MTMRTTPSRWGNNIAWGVGKTERESADLAELRWRRTFGRSVRPTRKAVVVRKVHVMNMLPAGTRNPGGKPVMRRTTPSAADKFHVEDNADDKREKR